MAKIADFMRKFNEVLQLDGKVNEVSECEVENLRKALSFSSITSVGTNSAAESDVEKRYKGINKGIVQNINKRLEEQFKYNFNNKQYRKNVDRRKTSDGVGYVEFKDLEFPYTFRYVIRTNYYNLETVLDIAIYTTGVSKDKEKFKMFFDKSPIGSVAGDFDDEPAWWYDNLLKYSSDCQNLTIIRLGNLNTGLLTGCMNNLTISDINRHMTGITNQIARQCILQSFHCISRTSVCC